MSLLGWYIVASGGALIHDHDKPFPMTCRKDANLQTVDEDRRHHNAWTTEDGKDNADNDPFIPERRKGNDSCAANRNSDDYGREDEHRGDMFDQLPHMRRLHVHVLLTPINLKREETFVKGSY